MMENLSVKDLIEMVNGLLKSKLLVSLDFKALFDKKCHFCKMLGENKKKLLTK